MRNRAGIVALACATVTLGLVVPAVADSARGASALAGDPTREREASAHWSSVDWAPQTHEGAAITMRNGSVLAVTGFGRAFVFDPSVNRWTPTRPVPFTSVFPMVARLPHGKVLLFGGCHRPSFRRTGKSAVYNPRSERWTQVGSMHVARNDAAVVRLPGGRVLAAGGNGPRMATPLASAEIYHPRSGRWSKAGELSRARASADAIRLGRHTVMVAGGSEQGPRRVDLFDTRSMTWRDGPRLPRPAWSPTLAPLPHGSVLAIGLEGRRHPRNGSMERGVVRYRPALREWTRAPHVPGVAWYTPPVTLSNGRPVVVGGVGNDCRRSVFSFGSDGWRRLPDLPVRLCTTDVVTLRSQDILAIGGFDEREGSTSLRYLHTTFRLHR